MKIELNFAPLLRLENIVLPDDTIAEFSSDTYTIDDLIVCAKNGKIERKWRVKDGFCDLSPVMFAGTMELSVHLVRNGETLKTWRAVPVTIREQGGEYLACDELNDLKSRVAELEEKTKIIM